MPNRIRHLALASALAVIAGGASAAQAADVTLWSFLDPAADGARSAALTDVINAYQSANAGSKVSTNVVEWDQLAPSLLRAAQAGNTPDLAMVYSPDMPALVAAGALTPLDSCFSTIWSDADRKDVVLLSAAKGSDGSYYGVPYELRVFGFYYRADELAKAGLKAPASFDELLASGQKAASDGQAGLGMTFNAGGGSVEAIEWFVPMIIGAGGKILNDDGSAAFNSPQVTDLLDRLHKAVQDKILPSDVVLSSTDDVEQLAQSGRAVFIAEGSQEASSFQETATSGMQWVFIPPPSLEAGKTSPAVLNGWNLVIPKGAKNADAACQLIKTWTSADIQKDQAVKAGYMPVRASLGNDPALQAPAIASIPTLLAYASSNPLNFTWPENTDLLNEVLSTMIQQVITDKASAADAIAAAEKDYNSRRQ
jgi:ABC-type glycerol-3-phosphate transport system substrate-binding protein